MAIGSSSGALVHLCAALGIPWLPQTILEINLMPFSHGTDSIGLEPIEGWRDILSRAPRKGQFIGVDEDQYPRDFATLIRYYPDLKKVVARYPLPGPLTWGQLDAFLAQAGDGYAARFAEVPI